jgi:uncharacterized membrane protein YfcA
MSMDFKFSIVGFIIGVLIGLTGMGGGSLMTPVMILVMGVKPVIAVGTDLAYGAVTKIIGGAAHFRMHTVHRRTSLLLSIGSVPATVLGVGVTSAIKRSNPDLVNVFLLRGVAVVLIIVSLVLATKPLIEARIARYRKDQVAIQDRVTMLGERTPWVLPILGAVVGFMVGLTSVGSGTLIILGLFLLYPRWESKELVGTDVFHAAILVSAAAVAQFSVGNVNVPMMLSLLIGSIPGVLIGSRLVIRVPSGPLRMGLAAVMLVSGAKMF